MTRGAHSLPWLGALILFGSGCGSEATTANPETSQSTAIPRSSALRYVDRREGIELLHPPRWHVTRTAITQLASPRQVLVASTFHIHQAKPNYNCTPKTAMKEMPVGGSFIVLLESVNNGLTPHEARRHFSPAPKAFHLRRRAEGDYECFGFANVIAFREAGRHFFASAYFGKRAKPRLRRQAEHILDSLRVRPSERAGA